MTTDHLAFRPFARVLLVAAILLMVPLVAMQFTDEVVWSAADFAVAGTLLVGAGFTYVLVARKGGSLAYRAAVGLAVASGLFLVWANLAVGLIGNENDAVNLMYLGVLAVGVVGAFVARFQPRGMARTLFAMAIAQVAVAVVALTVWEPPVTSGVAEVAGVTGLFVALFAGSGLLFRHAAREQPAR